MASGFSVAITANDRFSGTIARANAGFGGLGRQVRSFTAPFERFGTAASKLGNATGITQVARGVQQLGSTIDRAGASLGRFAPGLVAVTSLGTVAGLARLANEWTRFGTRLGLDAQRIGTSAAGLHGLQGAATLAGSSAEALTDGMRTLGDNLVDAVGGRSPETIQMLSTLGIAFRDTATGGARLATDALPEIADKIAAIKNPSLQARAAVALFGGAGEALLPFLRRGAAGIEEYNRQALQYGVMNERGVAAANAMREAQSRLGLATTGVAYAVAERLAPVLVPMLDRFSTWIASHREDIAQFFEMVARKIEAWEKSGGIAAMMKGFEAFGTSVKQVSDALGGPINTIELFFGLWVGSKAIGAIAAIGTMVTALRSLGALAGLVNPATLGLAAGAAVGAAAGAAADRQNRRIEKGGEYFIHPETGQFVAGPNSALMAPRDMKPVDEINEHLEKIDMHLLDALGRRGPFPSGVPMPSSMPNNRPSLLGAGMGMPGAREFPRGGPAVSPGGGFSDRAPPVMQRLMRDFGLNATEAAGIAGNLGQESGIQAVNETNPLVPGSRGGFGWAQWTGPRRVAFEKWAAERGMNGTDPEANYGFLAHELANTPHGRAALTAVRGAATPEEAARRFFPFESGGDPRAGYGRRGSFAREALRSYSAVPPPPAPPVQPAPAPAPSGQSGAAGPNGQATVRLAFDNPPPGLRTTVISPDKSLRIERPEIGGGP